MKTIRLERQLSGGCIDMTILVGIHEFNTTTIYIINDADTPVKSDGFCGMSLPVSWIDAFVDHMKDQGYQEVPSE